jgi:hypothetical protein
MMTNRELGAGICKWSNTANRAVRELGLRMLCLNDRPSCSECLEAHDHFLSLINGMFPGTTHDDIEEWNNLAKEFQDTAKSEMM